MKGIAVKTLPPSTSVPAKAHTKNGKQLNSHSHSAWNRNDPVRSERHRAKVEVAGAIPAVDAIVPLCLSIQTTCLPLMQEITGAKPVRNTIVQARKALL